MEGLAPFAGVGGAIPPNSTAAALAAAPLPLPLPLPVASNASALAAGVLPLPPSVQPAAAAPSLAPAQVPPMAPVVPQRATAPTAPPPAPLPAPPPAPIADEGAMGSAALFGEYERCLASLESVISGGLQQKSETLASHARAVEVNMEAVSRSAEAMQREADAEAAGVAERLHARQRQKLAVLQAELSTYALDMDAIDSFVKQTMELAARPPPSVSPAAHAQRLLEMYPELMSRAQRLLRAPTSPPTAVPADDFEDERADRRQQMTRLASLEKLLRVKVRCGLRSVPTRG